MRGLKLDEHKPQARDSWGRTSRGVRGLKYGYAAGIARSEESHLSRGAWIEIIVGDYLLVADGSHLSRGAWIEMEHTGCKIITHGSRTSRGVRGLKLTLSDTMTSILSSHLSRGAWIEMLPSVRHSRTGAVAPLAGCVD